VRSKNVIEVSKGSNST